MSELERRKIIRSENATEGSKSYVIAFTRYNDEKPSDTASKASMHRIPIPENIVKPARKTRNSAFRSLYEISVSAGRIEFKLRSVLILLEK